MARLDKCTVLLAQGCLEGKDAGGTNHELLGLLVDGKTFHLVFLLEDTHKNQKAAEVLKYPLCCVREIRLPACLRDDAEVERLEEWSLWQRKPRVLCTASGIPS